jgi:hypothetical protein
MRFKNVAAAHVSPQAVCKVYFPEIEGRPWLEIKPAGETNPAFLNPALRASAKSSANLVKGVLSTEELAKERSESYELYAQHILTGNGGGWCDDETGEEFPMPLSVDQRLALCKQLPGDLFDKIRRMANDLSNFRG